MPHAPWPFEDRFWPRIEFDPFGGCWFFTGHLDPAGYGELTGHGETLVHRGAYRHFVGAIPAGFRLTNRCGARCCANPAHWKPMSPLENVRLSLAHHANKTHCVSGHPFDAENTRFYKGTRRCRACDRLAYSSPAERERKRAYAERRRERSEKRDGDRSDKARTGGAGPENV